MVLKLSLIRNVQEKKKTQQDKGISQKSHLDIAEDRDSLDFILLHTRTRSPAFLI